MRTIMQIAAMNRPSEPAIPIPGIRYVPSPTATPLAPPPYSSIIDDGMADIAMHKRVNELWHIAMRPIRLHAGQSTPENGGIGRFAAPQIPEIIGGGLVGINI